MKTRLRLIIVAVVLVGWFLLNPPGRFGICIFGLTTYNCIPRPALDFQVRCDGATRMVEKTHGIKLTNVQWLIAPTPDVLIIGIGWDGEAAPEKALQEITQCKVHILKTGDAIKLYNQLKKQKKNVAIHLHSTC